MKEFLNKNKVYFIGIGLFILVTFIYFPGILSGKVINATDNATSRGAAHESVKYEEKTGKSPLWSGSMFGGMPSYFIKAPDYNNYIPPLTRILNKGIAYPVNAIFIAMVSFFILLLVLKVNPWLSIAGAIGFSFSTTNIILLDTGHNIKIVAIALMPLIIAGIIMILKGKYLQGFVVLTLGGVWTSYAAHYQMTYYLLIFIAIFMAGEIVFRIINKESFFNYIKTVGIMCLSGILIFLTFLPRLWSEYDYSKYSTRSETELTKDENDNTSGLDKSYILSYSYSPGEALSAIIPRIKGGGMAEKLGENSSTYKFLKKNTDRKTTKSVTENAPMYWGVQPIVAGPFYFSAILFFLFILSLLTIDRKYVGIFTAIVVISFLFSLGSHFKVLSNFLLEYLPMYNKFRDVKMIIVIQHIAMATAGMMAISNLFSGKFKEKEQQKKLMISFLIAGGFLFLFVLIPGLAGNFQSNSDEQFIQSGWPQQFVDALMSDRKRIVRLDAFRSTVFIALVAVGILLAIKKKIKVAHLAGIVAVLFIIDLWSVDKKYLNNDDFVSPREFKKQQFEESNADKIILADTDIHYRVLNLRNPFSDARTSYYHKSLGGYSAVKMRRYQELIENHISKEMMALISTLQSSPEKANATLRKLNVINMLNGKYFILSPESQPLQNPYANSSVWFVDKHRVVANADEEINNLHEINTKHEAIISESFANKVTNYAPASNDSIASIQISQYTPDHLIYNSNANEDHLAVFSEIFYDKGWKAYLDGKETDHFRANYVLRAMVIPKGNHKIEFKFEPKSFYAGNKVSMASSIFLIALVLLAIGIEINKLRKKQTVEKD